MANCSLPLCKEFDPLTPSKSGKNVAEKAKTSELKAALSRQRSIIDSASKSFENEPIPSNADASHLDGISFTAPQVLAWLRSLPGAPEEDVVAELLAVGIAERGERPSHAPRPGLTDDDDTRLAALSAQLASLQQLMDSERTELSLEKSDLKRREAEVISQEARLKAERDEQRCIRETLVNYPRPAWLEQVNGTINIGVVGNSGVGKSLLINTLRGVHPGTDGWAHVGVKETTQSVSMYAFPNERRVRLWDFPGAGTPQFPLETYISKMGLRYLDRVVLVTATRFTETELALVKELQEYNVPFCMVRTKADMDIWNNTKDNAATAEQTIAEIRADIEHNCQVRPYVVSLRDTAAYEFPNLFTDILPWLQDVGEDEAWAMPVAYSHVVSRVQGRWCDEARTVYFVQGLQVHVQKASGQCGEKNMVECAEGKVWWNNSLWIDSAVLNQKHGELQWMSKWATSKLKQMVWKWVV